jgi:hypothetical protein
MDRFCYQFGFETPRMERLNKKDGDDAKALESVWILAESRENALEWGNEIAQRFIQKLFGDPAKSWKAGRFARWVEDAFEWKDSDKSAKKMQTVRVGSYPDFDRMVQDWR